MLSPLPPPPPFGFVQPCLSGENLDIHLPTIAASGFLYIFCIAKWRDLKQNLKMNTYL